MNLSSSQRQKVWSQIDRSGGPDACWPFTQPLLPTGYARVWAGSRPEYAHRLAYTLAVGPIPDDLTIDHLCRNRACCNPAHLEPVTLAENIRRSHRGVDGLPITQCGNGHGWTPETTLWKRKGTYRVRDCRSCRRAYQAAYRERRRTAA